MKVFVTGASGFIGSAVVRELLSSGHQVTGLARSEKSAKAITDAGAQVLNGRLEDLEILKQGAGMADGVIHCGFNHDFMTGGNSSYADSAATDENAINAIGEALKATNKSFLVTAGMLGLPLIDGYVTEESTTLHSPRTSEAMALALAKQGVRVSVMRLPPSVHDRDDRGFIPSIISLARKHGISAYPNEGKNSWCAVHRLDAAKAYRLAVEKGSQGALFNITGDNAIELKTIATLIGETLKLSVKPVADDELSKHFEWMSHFITMDCPASNRKTQEQLEWIPSQIGLLEDMQTNYLS